MEKFEFPYKHSNKTSDSLKFIDSVSTAGFLRMTLVHGFISLDFEFIITMAAIQNPKIKGVKILEEDI